MKDKHEVLKKYFGYDSFRPGQSDMIDSVLDTSHNGTLCVMPTGGGKSLVYQIPSIMCDGLTIVVSPLISLMKDQVDALHKNGIDAAFYNSSQTKNEQESIVNSLTMGLIDLLYVSPERFGDTMFMDLLKEQKICLFAIDEAHLVSQWGHDFRPSYRRLKRAIMELQPERVAAFTATATTQVQDDICEQLGIPYAKRFIMGFYRENLVLDFQECDKNYKIPTVCKDVYNFSKQGVKTGIIYASTRDHAEEIASYLSEEYNIESTFYHAGMKDNDRQLVQQAWSQNGGIIVATCAFGMGIDRADVRFVIHANLPGSIEAWYQECVDENSYVTLEDGYKKIKDIKIGDKVVSYNHDTKLNELKEVKNVFCSLKTEWCKILTKTGMILDVTTDHPIYDVETDRYKYAKYFKKHDTVLITDKDYMYDEIVNIEYYIEEKMSYNLSVNENNTFYVNNILTHNCGRAGRDGKESFCRTYFDSRADVGLHKWFINMALPPMVEIRKFWFWLNAQGKHSKQIKMTQDKMSKLSKCQYVSGSLALLKKHKMVTTEKRGEYELTKYYDNPYEIDKIVDWQEYSTLRNYKFSMLDQIVNLAMNYSTCRMLQVLQYFGDTTYNDVCGKCDVCIGNA